MPSRQNATATNEPTDRRSHVWQRRPRRVASSRRRSGSWNLKCNDNAWSPAGLVKDSLCLWIGHVMTSRSHITNPRKKSTLQSIPSFVSMTIPLIKRLFIEWPKELQNPSCSGCFCIHDIISKSLHWTGTAIKRAVELGLILQEELIGIEDLVSEKSSSQFVQDRNAHTAAVLKAQKLMKNWN